MTRSIAGAWLLFGLVMAPGCGAQSVAPDQGALQPKAALESYLGTRLMALGRKPVVLFCSAEAARLGLGGTTPSAELDQVIDSVLTAGDCSDVEILLERLGPRASLLLIDSIVARNDSIRIHGVLRTPSSGHRERAVFTRHKPGYELILSEFISNE